MNRVFCYPGETEEDRIWREEGGAMDEDFIVERSAKSIRYERDQAALFGAMLGFLIGMGVSFGIAFIV